MRFELKEKTGYLPDLVYGGQGRELECFIPSGHQWEQINFGQGEGQVLIDGCEWGFYYSDNSAITVILHRGSMNINVISTFIGSVNEKIFGDRSSTVEIALVGTENE